MMSIQLELRVTAGTPIYRGNDHYWSVIRDLGKDKRKFTLQQIAERVDDDCAERAADFLRRLLRGGYVEIVSGAKKGYRTRVFRLLKRPAATPCLNRDGTPGRQGRVQEQVWVAMRSLKTFDTRELTIAASTDEVTLKPETVQSYIAHLDQAGYLQQLRKRSGTRGAIWRLKPGMNTGPRPPKILRSKMVYDVNLKEFMGRPVAEECAA